MPRIKRNNPVGRPSKDYEYFNAKLEASIYDELDTFSKETGVTKTKAVEKGLRMYLDQYYKTGRV